jgi:hypothetical protein
MTAAAKLTPKPRIIKKSVELMVKEPLQIRIPTSVKRAFKSAAALRGMEPNELFVEVWNYYEQSQHNTAQGTKR